MESSLFDRWVRTLSSGLTRRRLAGLSVLLALGLASETEARKKRKKKCKRPCGECRACKRGKCKTAANGTPCTGGGCVGGQCLVSAFCADKAFCDSPQDPPECQASGADCLCEVTTAGAHVCTSGASFHLEESCAACTGPNELCLSPVGCPENSDKVGCATPCGNPL